MQAPRSPAAAQEAAAHMPGRSAMVIDLARVAGLLRRVAAMALALVVAALATVSVAAPASAHTGLSGSTPAEGSMVTAPVTMVALRFTEPVSSSFATVQVTGAAGGMTTGRPSVKGATVTAPVAGLSDGSYRITYRVVSSDGHPVSGTVTFKVRLPAPTATPSSTASEPTASTPAVTPGDSPSTTPAVAAGGPGTAAAGGPAGGADEQHASGRLIGGVSAAILLLLVGGAVLIWESRRRAH